jgi:hypothetical protein
MTRRLLNLLTALSLLLCVAVTALWVRVRVCWDIFHVRLPGHVVYVSTDPSGVAVGWWRRAEYDIFAEEWRSFLHAAESVSERAQQHQRFFRPYVHWRFAGFYKAQQARVVPRWTAVGVPLWFPLVVFGVLPTARVRALARRRRHRSSGLCPSCGYDLRATPGRCPECGRPPDVQLVN